MNRPIRQCVCVAALLVACVACVPTPTSAPTATQAPTITGPAAVPATAKPVPPTNTSAPVTTATQPSVPTSTSALAIASTQSPAATGTAKSTAAPTKSPAAAPTYPAVPGDYVGKKPPFDLKNADAIAQGKLIFKANCTFCHGAAGKGDGAAGASMNPKPRDLTSPYSAGMTPEFWFWRVSEGKSGTEMPAWKASLSAESIWQVIAYARTFSKE
jgi:mono/diheme cytochrome c family protein